MRRLLFIALTVSASTLLAACGAAGGGLSGQTWHLTAITEKVPAFQGVVPAEEQANYTILFNSDGTYAAKADCNQTGGTYTTSGTNELSITPGQSTMAFCGEFSLDMVYINALSQAASYAIADGELTITLQDEGTLTFVAASSDASAAPDESAAAASIPAPGPAGSVVPGESLAGKAWQLTALTEKVPAFQGVVPDADQPRYTVEFLTDGTFTAKADCNSVGGTYTTADPAAASGDIEILPGPSTLVACPEGSLGDLFVIGLGSASSYAVADGILTLTLSNGGTLEFK